MLREIVKTSPILSKKIRIGDIKADLGNLNFVNELDPLADAGGAQTSNNLNFAMQHQTQTQWCWSAVSVSTSLFYNSNSAWTQCTLANQQLGQTTCCQDGSTAACNRWWYLHYALTGVGNLDHWVNGTISFSGVQQQINSTLPLSVRIEWADGSGHFVVLDGYDSANGDVVSVKDPWYGPSTYVYDEFSSRYQGSGAWTHSYYTKA
ncbi:MAG TPA: papain-like cysteine protease family protein [Pyrinomonadaceae bacterium]|jgi:hypothetical protein